MKNVKLMLASLAILGFATTSCENDKPDTEKPKVTIVKPTSHQVIGLGSKLEIEANLTDNEALAAYKIDVHWAGDGHSHGDGEHNHTHSVTIPLHGDHDHDHGGEIKGNKFNHQKNETIPGSPKTYTAKYSVEVPKDSNENHYHVGVIVIDKAGNESQAYTTVFLGSEENHHGGNH